MVEAVVQIGEVTQGGVSGTTDRDIGEGMEEMGEKVSSVLSDRSLGHNGVQNACPQGKEES